MNDKAKTPAPNKTATARPGDPPADWELASLWSRTWRYVKWSITALIAIAFLSVIGQGFWYYQMVSAVNPWLGAAFVAILTTLLILLVGRPLMAWFNTPLAAMPPDTVLDPAQPARATLIERMDYNLRFLKSLQRHPDLTAERPRLADSIETGKGLLADIRKADAIADVSFVSKIIAFEGEHIEAHLKPLDEKVDRLIHGEAVGIGVATAVSMNGTIDAFIVLWRSANLIARISRIYFGRPNLRGSLLVMRDVAAIVIASRALEDVTDVTGDLLGSGLGRMGGLVAGPVMDGAVNAMMALKLGYLTKRRCRAYRGWQKEQARSISSEALARVMKESTSVLNELVKACGGLTGAAARATESVMTGSKNTWSTIQSWFGTKPQGA